ncbi:MAG: pantetheine-phosphate adenylyltransferase [Candidatus Latescibacteria bacterium]|nr:pantetheine-phosphate adenylyltransferase [Candidatus Latescibacterota bacterium]NIM20995.1 pantetheine-phosphate adenylyltransferase [Candidatus Latescibacterota bacterium]NIM65130.1 pantetheine-phosphate adenylyltransferase [Candidatus Latescibacterota bacterium]NIO01645.1 pantetheine-phosphate adenylyltransferase [Candidatus Latescibacterota bacterium]NIO28162.1 pantetheine-phosphate adenylyltransferase [Candidatus Latescibacterota bacterium]
MTKALYPGTFDPITNGHLDIIERASKLFDSLVIAIARGVHKETNLPLQLRKRLVEKCTTEMKNVSVESFSGLLAEECERLSADVVIRGLRAVSDFEYEMMMALMNRKLNPGFETIFMMPSEQHIYLHSQLVREIFSLGGDISCLVPEPVRKALEQRLKRGRR